MLQFIHNAETRRSSIIATLAAFSLCRRRFRLEDRPCSRSLSWAALTSLISLALCASPAAQAQGTQTDTYTVTYSGGATTAIGSTDFPTGPYTPASAPGQHVPAGNAYGGSASNHQIFSGNSVTVNCQGSVTATFTWYGGPNNDPAPVAGSVIVVEQVNASCNGQTGSVSSDLPGGTSSGSSAASQTYTASRYSVQGGGSFSVTCTPTAFASSTAPPGGASGATADVGYTASVSPVFVTPGGVNAANQALTGQQITAQFSGLPAGYKVTSYTWSFTGGTAPNPIKNWDPNGLAADKVTLQQLFPLTSDDLTGTDTTGNGIPVKSLSFYDQVADSVTVKCTVNFKFPDGTIGAVTPQSQPVKFLKPTVTNWGIKSGVVRSPGGITGLFNVPGDTVYTDGQSWYNVVINVPSQFPGGQFSFAQTLISALTVYRQLPQGSTASPDYVQTNNGVNGLDTIFPYFTPFTIPNQPINKELVGDSPQVAVPNLNVTITVPPSDNGGTSWNRTTASDQFTTWLIYMPPGQSSIWVPLQKYSWVWSGTMIYDFGWTQTAGSPTAGATPTASNTDTPPSWTIVHSANDPFKSP